MDQKIIELKRVDEMQEQENANLQRGREEKDTSTATTTATSDADPGSAKMPTAQLDGLKVTSDLKEQASGKINGATAEANSAATATATATAGASGVKQGGVSLDPTHSNDATAALCSHPACSQPGTKFCGMCKTVGYCCANCQTADWPRHKVSCEGQLLKVGKGHLDKARVFHQNCDWLKSLHRYNLALEIMNRLKKRPHQDISEARRYESQARRTLDQYDSQFYYVVYNGHLEVVQCLLERGANKDKANNIGTSPLLTAAQNGHLDVVQYLLKQGADKDKVTNNGASLLHFAAHNGHLGVVPCLVNAGADKDKADYSGATPLLAAVQDGHLSVVQCLVEKELTGTRLTTMVGRLSSSQLRKAT